MIPIRYLGLEGSIWIRIMIRINLGSTFTKLVRGGSGQKKMVEEKFCLFNIRYRYRSCSAGWKNG
jgi:hypothetical protein